MEAVWVALIVGPLTGGTIAFFTGRQRRAEKRQDYEREDKLETRRRMDAAANAASLREGQEEAARLLLDANERVAATTGVVVEKLDVIHTLVNSQMTAAMQAEYDATVREVAMMREVVELKRAAGHDPTAETLAAISLTDGKVSELRARLRDREENTP